MQKRTAKRKTNVGLSWDFLSNGELSWLAGVALEERGLVGKLKRFTFKSGRFFDETFLGASDAEILIEGEMEVPTSGSPRPLPV